MSDFVVNVHIWNNLFINATMFFILVNIEQVSYAKQYIGYTVIQQIGEKN